MRNSIDRQINTWKQKKRGGYLLASLLLLLALFCPPASLKASDWGGLQIGGAADLIADFGFKDANRDRKLNVRSVELMLYGPTDHLFEGVLSFAAHEYQGEFNLGLHEAFIKSSRLIPRTRFQIGQFFLGVGRLNALHQHDWPFIDSPLTQAQFFDGEGIIDSGLEVAWLSPLPFYMDLTVGVTNGWRITHSHGDAGKKPSFPTHYAKLEFFQDLPAGGGLLWALNYLGRRDSDKTWLRLAGAHAVAKWREANFLRVLLQAEVWARFLKPQGVASENQLGGYLYAQYGWSPLISTGLRFDMLSSLSLKDLDQKSVPNHQMQFSPQINFSVSEMAVFRAGYSYLRDFQRGRSTGHEHQILLQSIFILGAHPAHDF